jgi:hypothetical protein
MPGESRDREPACARRNQSHAASREHRDAIDASICGPASRRRAWARSAAVRDVLVGFLRRLRMNNRRMGWSIVSATVFALGMSGCLSQDGSDDPETGSAVSHLTGADPDAATRAPAAPGAPGQAAPTPSSGTVTINGVDWRVDWPVAGLYNDDCHGGIREDTHSGDGIQWEGSVSDCNGTVDQRFYVTHLATGHRGWIRAAALRLP